MKMKNFDGYLIGAGSSGSSEQEVLQGIPVQELVSNIDIWKVITSPFYYSGVVNIPSEIADPLTIFKLSNLNQFLVDMQYDFFGGVIQPIYIRSLQEELYKTRPELLPAKLDSMLNIEYLNWYINNPGGGGFVPSPLEQLNYYPFHFCILIIFIAIICIFWRIKNKKRKNEKCEESKPS